MQITRLENYTKGWVVGDFEPNVIKTKDFEFAVKFYEQGDKEQNHIHKVAKEITVIVNGEFKMNQQNLKAGDVVYLAPGEAADFECLSKGSTAVIKTPSVQGDKYNL
jgi:quercetin dioxygenase-like cupin family protein